MTGRTVLTRLDAVTSLHETPLGLIRKWSCSLLTLNWRKDTCSQRQGGRGVISNAILLESPLSLNPLHPNLPPKNPYFSLTHKRWRGLSFIWSWGNGTTGGISQWSRVALEIGSRNSWLLIRRRAHWAGYLSQETTVVRNLGRAHWISAEGHQQCHGHAKDKEFSLWIWWGSHTLPHLTPKCSPYRDVGVTQLGPAVQVQEAVDTADLTPHEPLPLGQVQGIGCVEVIDGRHHGEVCRGTGHLLGQGLPSAVPCPAPILSNSHWHYNHTRDFREFNILWPWLQRRKSTEWIAVPNKVLCSFGEERHCFRSKIMARLKATEWKFLRRPSWPQTLEMDIE